MALESERQECLTLESEDFCFYRLGELFLEDITQSEGVQSRNGLISRVAVAAKHGWTILVRGNSKFVIHI